MNGFQTLAIVVGWGLAIGIGLLWLVILWLIVIKRIDLQYLISESSGGASMSRFQLLIFTFVIAITLFLVTVGQNPPTFPSIPPEILGLLGISAGSYVLSKGIQTSGEVSKQKMNQDTNPPVADATPPTPPQAVK